MADQSSSRSSSSFLSGLSDHPIFVPSSNSDEEWELLPRPNEALAGAKKRRIASRNGDLLVAIGSEVRMTSLTAGENGKRSMYNVLKSEHLEFSINQLLVNPAGKLLAVVGDKQIVVVVLPQKADELQNVEVQAFPVDECALCAEGNHVITQVRWHPLGESGNSLWVLTSDGKIREYDLQQPGDPAQTLAFLPTSTSSTSKFSAVDPLSRYATSFNFGPTTSSPSWGPLMVHVLIANGDIFTMGPVMPLRMQASLKWIQGLKALVQAKKEYIGSNGDAHEIQANKLQGEWLEGLSKQMSRPRASSSVGPGTPNKTPLRQSILSGRPKVAVETQDTQPLGMARLHPPHLTPSGANAPGIHRNLRRQGPMIMDPAPPEGDEEDVASDLAVLSIPTDSAEGSGNVVEVMGITWSSGRVDLGVMMESLEPRWAVSKGISEDTTYLPIIESIQLSADLSEDPDYLSSNAPAFQQDPVNKDTIYVQHALGVASLCIQPWVSVLMSDQQHLPPTSILRCVTSTQESKIEGLIVLNSISVGYGLLAIASSNQVAALELDLKLGGAVEQLLAIPKESRLTADGDKSSLLLAKPVNFDQIIASARSNRLDLAGSLRKLSTAGKPITQVSAEHLRAVGEAVAQVQARIQAIRRASQMIENRLDIQIRELQRQFELLKTCSSAVKSLQTGNAKRVEAISSRQDQLSERMDKILQSLSRDVHSDVGDVEKSWFEELDKIRTKIHGGGGIFGLGRTKGLITKVQLIDEQLLGIKSMLGVEGHEEPEMPGGYASKQLGPLESALSARSDELKRLMRRMEYLNMRIDGLGEGDEEVDEGDGTSP